MHSVEDAGKGAGIKCEEGVDLKAKPDPALQRNALPGDSCTGGLLFSHLA